MQLQACGGAASTGCTVDAVLACRVYKSLAGAIRMEPSGW